MVEINLTLVEITWMAIGFMFARAFGKNLDYKIRYSVWLDDQPEWVQYLVAGLLNFLHHWWMGLLIYIYAPIPEIRMFGLGMFIDDIPDIPPRFRKYFKYLFEVE